MTAATKNKLGYTPETIRKHRKKWVEALKSGDYMRTSGQLCRIRKSDEKPVGFCCLGVAADLAKVPYESVIGGVDYTGTVRPSLRKYSNTIVERHGGDRHKYMTDGYLPALAQRWLGVKSQDPRINTPMGRTLSSLNDSGEYTLQQIGELIEKYGIHPDDDLLAKV